jgi:hypothetical protein
VGRPSSSRSRRAARTAAPARHPHPTPSRGSSSSSAARSRYGAASRCARPTRGRGRSRAVEAALDGWLGSRPVAPDREQAGEHHRLVRPTRTLHTRLDCESGRVGRRADAYGPRQAERAARSRAPRRSASSAPAAAPAREWKALHAVGQEAARQRWARRPSGRRLARCSQSRSRWRRAEARPLSAARRGRARTGSATRRRRPDAPPRPRRHREGKRGQARPQPLQRIGRDRTPIAHHPVHTRLHVTFGDARQCAELRGLFGLEGSSLPASSPVAT